MRIGLDIDNVITAFDEGLLKEYLIEDKNKRNSGIINKHADHITKGMFDWTEQEVDEFYANNMERIAAELKPRKGAKKYIDKLVADGNEIFLISHRAYPHYKHPQETTEIWLKKYDIKYNKLILSKSPDKSEECKKYKIDIMVDDRVSMCQNMQANDINCLLMLTKMNKKRKGDLPFVKDWKQLYKEIKNWKK